MIHLLLMRCRVELRGQSIISVEGLMTQIALPIRTTECVLGNGVLDVLLLMPSNLFLGHADHARESHKVWNLD